MFRKVVLTWALLASLSCWAGVEINQATEAELDSIKGLGPSSTARILAARQRGAFKDWEDVMRRVSGVRPASAAKLSAAGLVVNGLPYEPIQDAAKAPQRTASAAAP
jgi:competence protein ComEA